MDINVLTLRFKIAVIQNALEHQDNQIEIKQLQDRMQIYLNLLMNAEMSKELFIFGIPQHEREKVSLILHNIASAFNTRIEPEDIHRVYRVTSKNDYMWRYTETYAQIINGSTYYNNFTHDDRNMTTFGNAHVTPGVFVNPNFFIKPAVSVKPTVFVYPGVNYYTKPYAVLSPYPIHPSHYVGPSINNRASSSYDGSSVNATAAPSPTTVAGYGVIKVVFNSALKCRDFYNCYLSHRNLRVKNIYGFECFDSNFTICINDSSLPEGSFNN